MNTFNDILKNKFLNQITSSSPLECFLTLLLAIAVGLIIYFVYKRTFSGVVYSSSFNLSLLLMTVITAAIIITISSNAILSLGMVGALSIVRFRTVIKDPIDIMYLFWAISMGIIIGAKQYVFALICVVLIGAICVIMGFLKRKEQMYLVIVRYNMSITGKIDSAIESINGKVRNRTVSKSGVETIIEVKSVAIKEHFVEKLYNIPGVESAVLVNYNGEYCE
ncbi:MAG: DUF4956 domain-containing protein [Firmicutes bacterium]|nr:DUF4956 domain-containing protein [Bacillota bacterium]